MRHSIKKFLRCRHILECLSYWSYWINKRKLNTSNYCRCYLTAKTGPVIHYAISAIPLVQKVYKLFMNVAWEKSFKNMCGLILFSFYSSRNLKRRARQAAADCYFPRGFRETTRVVIVIVITFQFRERDVIDDNGFYTC